MEQQFQATTHERARLINILSNSPDLILTIDHRSSILFLNKAGEKFWNVKSSQLMGKNIRELFTGEPEDYDSFIISLRWRFSILLL